jgi:hypothetical protein
MKTKTKENCFDAECFKETAVDKNLIGGKNDHFKRNFTVKVKKPYFEIFSA